jgi:hypothetical protein
MCRISACLPRHQAKDVSRSHPNSTEPVGAPPRAAQGELELAVFAGSQSNRTRRMAVDHFDASRQLEQHLHAIYCPLRAQDQRRLDLGSFERPLGVHGEDDLDGGVSCSRPDGEKKCERCCDDRELGSP